VNNSKSAIKVPALSTAYGGRIFGSRYKARWALFMDLIGIEYAYRHDGNYQSFGAWEPDFCVDAGATYLHVSPLPIESERLNQAKFFVEKANAEQGFTQLFLIHGRIGAPRRADDSPYVMRRLCKHDSRSFPKDPPSFALEDIRYAWGECANCFDVSPNFADGDPSCRFCGEDTTCTSEALKEAYRAAQSIKLDSWANLRLTLAVRPTKVELLT